jgi:hypothetical protein
MAIAETAAPRFGMGRVVKRTFSAIGKNFGAFVLLSIVPGLAFAAASVAGGQFRADLAAAQFPDVEAILWFAFWGLIYFAGAILVQGGVIHGVMASISGKRASVGDCLSTALKHAVPLFLIALLTTLGFVAGLVLLIVPGVILAVMWTVAGPACVVEHAGMWQAFKRSTDLTRGYRWPIFGLFVASFVLIIVIDLITSLLVGIAFGTGMVVFSSNPVASVASNASSAELFAAFVRAMLALIISFTFGAAIYYELREIKEGIGPEALASVFD